MEQILEIRDGCSTPGQLLRSLAFSRFLKIYKKEFIHDLENRPGKHQQEASHKIDFINKVSTRDLIKILETSEFDASEKQEKARELIRFMDGAFHHYRGAGYSRPGTLAE